MKKFGGAENDQKTLTNLLLHEDGSFCSFGHKARTTYYEDAGNGIINKLFFQNFKANPKPYTLHPSTLTLNTKL